MNIKAALKIKGAWDKFCQNHPKFPMFLNAMQQRGITEDSVIAIAFTDREGKKIETNVKLTKEDMELFETLKDLM